MKKEKIVQEFNDIKELIYNSAKTYANNIAFIVKHQEGKNKTYENMKTDPRVNSFYLIFLFKAIFPYFKQISEQYTKDEIQAILHAFLSGKQRDGEIALGYTISCIACKKKICGPLFDLSTLPHTLICPHCGAKIDTDNDYLLLDGRYFFQKK